MGKWEQRDRGSLCLSIQNTRRRFISYFFLFHVLCISISLLQTVNGLLPQTRAFFSSWNYCGKSPPSLPLHHYEHYRALNLVLYASSSPNNKSGSRKPRKGRQNKKRGDKRTNVESINRSRNNNKKINVDRGEMDGDSSLKSLAAAATGTFTSSVADIIETENGVETKIPQIKKEKEANKDNNSNVEDISSLTSQSNAPGPNKQIESINNFIRATRSSFRNVEGNTFRLLSQQPLVALVIFVVAGLFVAYISGFVILGGYISSPNREYSYFCYYPSSFCISFRISFLNSILLYSFSKSTRKCRGSLLGR